MSKPTPKKAAKPAPEPRDHLAADPADQALFDKGRHAARGGIRREDSPYVGKEAKVWLKGWDYEAELPGGRGKSKR
jgi:3'-phosphoadenosine 5'-phosphosulfate sulfotransferase (PAPS reductase)/FAD synthetase